jgi:hypothetical protein
VISKLPPRNARTRDRSGVGSSSLPHSAAPRERLAFPIRIIPGAAAQRTGHSLLRVLSLRTSYATDLLSSRNSSQTSSFHQPTHSSTPSSPSHHRPHRSFGLLYLAVHLLPSSDFSVVQICSRLFDPSRVRSEAHLRRSRTSTHASCRYLIEENGISSLSSPTRYFRLPSAWSKGLS